MYIQMAMLRTHRHGAAIFSLVLWMKDLSFPNRTTGAKSIPPAWWSKITDWCKMRQLVTRDEENLEGGGVLIPSDKIAWKWNKVRLRPSWLVMQRIWKEGDNGGAIKVVAT